MKCSEIMKSDVRSLSPSATVADAAKQMRASNVGFLPVCDEVGRVIGAITDRDLAVRVLAEGRGTDTAVGDVMTTDVISCRPDDSLRLAEERMAFNHKSRIVCCDGDGRLMGVISLSDIAQVDGPRRVRRTLREITQREVRATP